MMVRDVSREVTHGMDEGSSTLVEMLLRQWDGEEVVIRYDRPAASWIVIAIHSTQRGPASGGTRMKSYPNLDLAVQDALRLSAAMTSKFVVAGLPQGGGKGVLAVPQGLSTEERAGLLRRYGSLIQTLGGLFQTGPDVGTSSADMNVISETAAPYIFGRTPDSGGSGDSGQPTAVGVFEGIRVTVRRLYGDNSLAGRRVVVQGVGSVGGPLAEYLVKAGADVLISDVNADAVERMHRHLGVGVITPEQVYDTPCDIFAPCALGAVLNRDTIARLRCRAVVGSANNQLETSADALRLKERGILYAPDFVVNVGGTISLAGGERMGWTRDEVERRIRDTVTQVLDQIYDLAAADDITTTEAAQRIVESQMHSAHA